MNEDASVRMTVDSSQAIAENQKYLRAATETFNQLLQKSEQYSGSLQQRIKFLEREVELERESIRLTKSESLRDVRLQYDEGKLTGKQFRRATSEIQIGAEEENKELKELTRLTKQWTTEQREAMRKAERLGADVSRMIPGFLSSDTAGGMVGSISGGLLAGTILGAIASVAIGKEIKGAMQMEPAVRDYAVLMGSSMTGIRSNVSATREMGLGKLGMTPSQYFTNYSQLYRAGGGVVNESMLGIMSGEKALGLSRSQIGNLMGLERYGEGKITPLLSFFERYLRDTSQSIAVLPEILQTFSQEATAMLKTTGRVDSASVVASVSAIGRAFGLTGEPLGTVVGAMRGGLQQSNNPTIQALQFMSMEKAMPGSSLWQMEMAMENPLANPRYVTGFLNQLRGTTGGGEMYARTLYNVFGQYGISKNIADKLSRGEISPEDFITEAGKFEATGTGGYRKRAEGVTGALEEVTASWQGFWERSGFNNVQALAEQMRSILDGISLDMSTTAETIADVRDFARDQLRLAGESKNFLEKIARGMIGFSASGSNIGMGPHR